jgi:hypothetical protein
MNEVITSSNYLELFLNSMIFSSPPKRYVAYAIFSIRFRLKKSLESDITRSLNT